MSCPSTDLQLNGQMFWIYFFFILFFITFVRTSQHQKVISSSIFVIAFPEGNFQSFSPTINTSIVFRLIVLNVTQSYTHIWGAIALKYLWFFIDIYRIVECNVNILLAANTNINTIIYIYLFAQNVKSNNESQKAKLTKTKTN